MELAPLRVLSELLSRAKLASQAGVTFGGKRDTYAVLGYKPTLTAADYWERYSRGGLAKNVVEIFPETTWRGGATIQEIEDPGKTTKFEGEWEALDERLSVWSIFEDADRLAGVGEYSIILIGAGDNDPREPLPQLRSTDDIGYLQVYKQVEVNWNFTEIDKDPKSRRYGLPLLYTIKEDFQDRKARDRQVHWTRIIHVPTDAKTNLLFGTPRLQAVWNLLDDLDKVTGGGAEAGWQQANPVTQFDIDKDIKINPADTEKLDKMKAEIDELVHNLRRYIRTQGVAMKTRESQYADFSNNADAIISQIAGTIKVPKRILLGAEAGELASTQDRANFAERIGDRRSQFALPVVVRAFVNRLAAFGAFTVPKSWSVKWPEIRNLSQVERTDVATKMAKMNDPKHNIIRVTTDEIRRVLGLDPLTDDQLKREQELLDMTPETAVAPAAPTEADTEEEEELPRAARSQLPAVVNGEPIEWTQ